jgi:hypothetical protein
MVSSEVQRTLVKSPPELWAELSDPAALARHLGELGEIRIVKTKPEERVEWESDGATGTVLIKPSGWGTKVTLSVTRELCETPTPSPGTEDAALAETQTPTDEIAAAPKAEPPAAAVETEEPPASEFAPEPVEEIEIAREDTPRSDVAPIDEPEAAPRRGFFSRLFRRRAQPVVEPSPVAVVEPTPQPEAVVATPAPEEAAQPDSEPEAPAISATEPATATASEQEQPEDLAAELQLAEEVAAEEVTAILTAALDRLGAAHHRPFSRS